jgi:hypothetical protein
MYPENPGGDTMVFASPGFPQETIHLGNGRWIHINAPGASPSTYYVNSLTLNGTPHTSPWVNYSRLASGVTLDWALGTEPTFWGSAPADAPPSYSAGLRPVVGFLSQQHATLAPGSSDNFTLGVQNATAHSQQARFHISAPAGSGLSVSPANGTISVEANGRGTLAMTLSARTSATLDSNWVTASVTTPGAATQTLKLDVQVNR